MERFVPTVYTRRSPLPEGSSFVGNLLRRTAMDEEERQPPHQRAAMWRWDPPESLICPGNPDQPWFVVNADGLLFPRTQSEVDALAPSVYRRIDILKNDNWERAVGCYSTYYYHHLRTEELRINNASPPPLPPYVGPPPPGFIASSASDPPPQVSAPVVLPAPSTFVESSASERVASAPADDDVEDSEALLASVQDEAARHGPMGRRTPPLWGTSSSQFHSEMLALAEAAIAEAASRATESSIPSSAVRASPELGDPSLRSIEEASDGETERGDESDNEADDEAEDEDVD
ncbi:hypothetical protein CVT26_002261 [Gymnopilus dilepis]|uniref:Uncharacterized protein n=1 Tax=Gymnopilus dilepis TaxID=231916 RepID=A0A409YX71_9AGAR|nr:hypothetical protein CVT26_002261 [Gymnopilus dilepis]